MWPINVGHMTSAREQIGVRNSCGGSQWTVVVPVLWFHGASISSLTRLHLSEATGRFSNMETGSRRFAAALCCVFCFLAASDCAPDQVKRSNLKSELLSLLAMLVGFFVFVLWMCFASPSASSCGRLNLCCTRSSCCGSVGSRGRYTPSGSPSSLSLPKGACWPLPRPGNCPHQTREQSLSRCGDPLTKVG